MLFKKWEPDFQRKAKLKELFSADNINVLNLSFNSELNGPWINTRIFPSYTLYSKIIYPLKENKTPFNVLVYFSISNILYFSNATT